MHAVRYHWRSFATDDVTVTMFIGPSPRADPSEVAVAHDEQGTATIRAMRALRRLLEHRRNR